MRGMKNFRRAGQGLGVIPIFGLIAHLIVLCFCTASCHEGACPPLPTPAAHAVAVESELGLTCCEHVTTAPGHQIECCKCPGPPPDLSVLVSTSGWDLPLAARIESPVELPRLQFIDRLPHWPETEAARAPPSWLTLHGARAPPFPLI